MRKAVVILGALTLLLLAAPASAVGQVTLLRGGISPRNITDVAGTAFFNVGTRLWKSDGTSTGTKLITNVNPSGTNRSAPSELTDVTGTLVVTADDGVPGRELWMSDGTATATLMVKDIFPGSAASIPQGLVNVNGTLFFNADDGTHGQELWKTDGTQTVLVRDINTSGSSAPSDLTSAGGLVFFTATDGSHGVELWRSDGTRGGTRRLTDIMPGSDSSNPGGLTNVNGTLYFHPGVAYPPNQGLWKSDGTTAGTVLVTYALFQGTGGPIGIGSTLYFTAWDQAHGTEVWKSNGTAQGTLMVDDIYPSTGQSWATQFTDLNGTLFFSATDGVYGRELWKTNGSAIGTVMVKDINPGYEGSMSLEPFAGVGGAGARLFFAADDGVHGFEIWESNGAPSGTVMMADINPSGSSYPSDLTTVGGAVFFAASDGTQSGLWKAAG